jgi:hypothetical protein
MGELSGAAQAARSCDGNTGRLAPCRYKVSGIGRKPLTTHGFSLDNAPAGTGIVPAGG